MAKSRERLLARELRKKGESIREIAKRLQISRSSSSLWCRDIVLSEEQTRVLIERDRKGGEIGRTYSARAKKEERLSRQRKYANFGALEVGSLSKRELFLVGLALYWAEGSKKRGRVMLVNSDPKMIVIFIMWLQQCFGIKLSQLTCRIAINEMHAYRARKIENYWSSISHVPIAQFNQTTLIHTKLQKVYENMETYFGVLSVYVRASTNMNYLVVGGIDHLGKISNQVIQ